MLRKFHACGCP